MRDCDSIREINFFYKFVGILDTNNYACYSNITIIVVYNVIVKIIMKQNKVGELILLDFKRDEL